MRLDHLLSKENILFLFCHLVGCLVRHLAGDKFLFSGEDKYRTWLYARVGGSVKQG